MDNQIINLFVEAENYFASSIAKRVKHFSDLASAYSSDIDDHPLNTLVIRKPTLSKSPASSKNINAD
jgi:hypothetical protein